MSRLVLVPTPIGNLEDITFRALRILKESDLILAEDTRVSRKLLSHFEVHTPCISFHQHNEHKQLESVLQRIEEAEMVAMVSDAGTPGISDPGFLLVRGCIDRGIAVECLPGPTAFVPALVNSGLPCDRFIFEGFLPHKKGRMTRLTEIAENRYTTVLYESPYRVVKTLSQLAEHLGEDRRASVSRELSKKFEETVRGTLSEVHRHFEKNEPKGEFVIIVEGKEHSLKKQSE